MQGMTDEERNAAARAKWSANIEVEDRFANRFQSTKPPAAPPVAPPPAAPTAPPTALPADPLTKQNPDTHNKNAASKTSTTKIAVAQLCSTASKASNLVTIFKLAASASSNNCSMLFLPEVATLLPPKGTTIDNAEPIPPPPSSPPFESTTLQTLSEIAKRNSLHISVGSMHESGAVDADTDEPRVWNTSLVIDDKGDLIGKYRKVHLFSIDTEMTKLSEASTTVGGTSLSPSIPTPLGPLGLAICYDLRFPYLSTSLRHSKNSSCLIYPSAFTVETGLRDWEVLLRSRAIENQCWVVAAAQVGRHDNGRKSYGHSVVVNPLGQVLLDMGGYTSMEEEDVDGSFKNIVKYVDVDLDLVRRVREEVLQVERHQVDLEVDLKK
ncbi:hypothetical protein TrVE_jg6064 [Triparma verrucosa]|uniref:CN hydrolase domain-containing protein n=1 Tax=Triparma verrucosa TaxID=1606542 RepID=A0A9W7C3C3_9STRA|nr:hypothetical protein TrVE_jg6064 [Triparma verrucosa]